MTLAHSPSGATAVAPGDTRRTERRHRSGAARYGIFSEVSVLPFDTFAALVGFLLALPTGTLVEYGLHRFLLHAPRRSFVTHRHRMHHKANAADTLWGDFRDFFPGMVPFGWFGFLHSISAGVGFALGGVFYVFVLALVHKLSHERPGLIFWMSPNAHALHHDETPRHNFGIVTRFWDVVFGTYADERPARNGGSL